MWGSILSPLLKAITAGLGVWKEERARHNTPEMVKNVLDIRRAALQDSLNSTAAIALDPNATPEQHQKALDELRRAMS